MIAMLIDKRLGLREMDVRGQALKKLRESRRWSQEDLAHRAEMTTNALSKLERGLHAPSRQTMRGLAAAFGMTEEELEEKLTGETVAIHLARPTWEHAVLKAGEKGMQVQAWIEERILGGKAVVKQQIGPVSAGSKPHEVPQPPPHQSPGGKGRK